MREWFKQSFTILVRKEKKTVHDVLSICKKYFCFRALLNKTFLKLRNECITIQVINSKYVLKPSAVKQRIMCGGHWQRVRTSVLFIFYSLNLIEERTFQKYLLFCSQRTSNVFPEFPEIYVLRNVKVVLDVLYWFEVAVDQAVNNVSRNTKTDIAYD